MQRMILFSSQQKTPKIKLFKNTDIQFCSTIPTSEQKAFFWASTYNVLITVKIL